MTVSEPSAARVFPIAGRHIGVGPFPIEQQVVAVDLELTLTMGWPATKTYGYSKLYYRSNLQEYDETRVVCFRVTRRHTPEIVRLILPFDGRRGDIIWFRLDGLPYTDGDVTLHHLSLAPSFSIDDPAFEISVCNAWKAHTRAQVELSERMQRAALPHYPESISLELTAGCNLTCGHCSSHGVPELHRYHNRAPVFTRDRLRKLALETFPYLTSICLVGRGEPTFVSDELWDDVFEYAERYNVLVNIVTNGLLFERRISEHHLPFIDTLTFSVDGYRAQTMAENRGGADLDGVIRAVRLYHDMRRNADLARRPKLSLSWTLKMNNVAEFPDFIGAMASVEPDLIYARHLLVFHQKDSAQSLFSDVRYANRFLSQAYALMMELGIPGDCPPLISELEGSWDAGAADTGKGSGSNLPHAAGSRNAEPAIPQDHGRRASRPYQPSQRVAPRRPRHLRGTKPHACYEVNPILGIGLPRWGISGQDGADDARGPDRCVYFQRSAVIMADGTMVTCARPYAEQAGSLDAHASFMELWNGDALTGCRAAFGTDNEWQQCRECWYRESRYAGQRDARSVERTFNLEGERSRYRTTSWDFRKSMQTEVRPALVKRTKVSVNSEAEVPASRGSWIMLTDSEKEVFRRQGYLSLQAVIDPELLVPALRALNLWREKIFRGKGDAEDRMMIATARYCKEAGKAGYMEPVRQTATRLAESVLGVDNVQESDCQLIGWAPSESSWKSHWHIDWVNKYLKFEGVDKFPGFQLLVGFPLTPCATERSANLVMSPGEHARIAEGFARAEDLGDELRRISGLMAGAKQPGDPIALLGVPGDAVIAHSLVPHSVARNDMPTYSDKLYFRFALRDAALRGGREALCTPWKNWLGMPVDAERQLS